MRLKNIGYIPIARHVKVIGAASPDDPALNEYWEKRRQRKPVLKRMTAFEDNRDIRKRMLK